MGAPQKKPSFRAAQAVALGLVLALGWMTRDGVGTSDALRTDLARKFKFVKSSLPELPSAVHQVVRPSNPSAANISAWTSSIGAAATLSDLDGDGIPNDLIYADPRTEQVIACPAPGTPQRYAPFVLTTGGHGMLHVGCAGTIAGDFNEDGRMDVLVYFMGRAPLIFLRKAGGALGPDAFTVQVPAAGLETVRWYSSAASMGDLDGDGRIDLVIGNFFQDGSELFDPQSKLLQQMHNSHGWASNGGGLHVLMGRAPTAADAHPFAEVKLPHPDEVIHGWVLGLAVGDLDGDLLPEVFAINDLGPDRMFHNRSTPGKLKLALVEGEDGFSTPGSFVVGHDTYHGMGCDQFDLNHDGVLDMFISNITVPFGLQESQTLWMSRPGRSFKDGVAPYEMVSERWGVARSGWGWDAKFESFANTVMPDLLQATGFFKGPVNRWPELQALGASNTAFLRDPRKWPRFQPGADLSGSDLDAFFTFGPDGRYHNVNRDVGLDQPMVSRGIATADVDGDGRVDFALANQFGPSYFFHNQSENAKGFLGLKLVLPPAAGKLAVLPGRQAVAGRPAYGAVASFTLPSGTKVMRAVDGGNGHSGRRAPELHFGLGDLPPGQPIEVALQWRDRAGRLSAPTKITVAAGSWYTVVLGAGAQEVAP